MNGYQTAPTTIGQGFTTYVSQQGQPAHPTPTNANPPETSSRSFLGRMVDAVTHPIQTLDKLSTVTSAFFKDLAEYTIDVLESFVVLVQSTLKHAAYGAAGGLVAGVVVSTFHPLMAPTILPFAVGAGATAGAIHGYIEGTMKASDFFNERQAQRAARAHQEADLFNQENPVPAYV